MIIRTAAIFTILVAATPVSAFAQTPGAPVAATQTFAPSVRIGQNVWVTSAQGSEAAVRSRRFPAQASTSTPWSERSISR